MSAWFYMLLKMCTEMIEKRKQNNKLKKKKQIEWYCHFIKIKNGPRTSLQSSQ